MMHMHRVGNRRAGKDGHGGGLSLSTGHSKSNEAVVCQSSYGNGDEDEVGEVVEVEVRSCESWMRCNRDTIIPVPIILAKHGWMN